MDFNGDDIGAFHEVTRDRVVDVGNGRSLGAGICLCEITIRNSAVSQVIAEDFAAIEVDHGSIVADEREGKLRDRGGAGDFNFFSKIKSWVTSGAGSDIDDGGGRVSVDAARSYTSE